MNSKAPITLPGATIGILGAGQLARMLSHAAQRLGYQTIAWSGGGDPSPALGVANRVIEADFEDPAACTEFLQSIDVATAEIEKIPPAVFAKLEEIGLLNPNANALRIASNRRSERELIANAGLPQTEFRLINTEMPLQQAWLELGQQAVAKTCFGGYDGRGQWILTNHEQVSACLKESQGFDLVVEKFVPFQCEISCLVARNQNGEIAVFDPAENEHRHHVLSKSIVPARVPSAVTTEAQTIAKKLAEALDYIGLLAIEFFVTEDHQLLINELAPRPHNSGHHTLDACVSSQFDQHIRAICNLPLGSTRLICPTVMVNLLSDQWPGDAKAAESQLFSHPECILHLYRKQWAPHRRKLGHANFVAPTLEQALTNAANFESQLCPQSSTT